MRLVLCCIDANFCKKIFVGKLLTRSTQCTPLHRFGIESQKTRKTMGGEKILVQSREKWPGEAHRQLQLSTQCYPRARTRITVL